MIMAALGIGLFVAGLALWFAGRRNPDPQVRSAVRSLLAAGTLGGIGGIGLIIIEVWVSMKLNGSLP